MEIKLQATPDAADIDNINKIELMGLYSSAIEFYHRQADEGHLNYYIDKNMSLNDSIRQSVERAERQKERE